MITLARQGLWFSDPMESKRSELAQRFWLLAMLSLVIECILFQPVSTSSSPEQEEATFGLSLKINVVQLIIASVITAVCLIPAVLLVQIIYSYGYSRASPLAERFAGRLLGGDVKRKDAALVARADPAFVQTLLAAPGTSSRRGSGTVGRNSAAARTVVSTRVMPVPSSSRVATDAPSIQPTGEHAGAPGGAPPVTASTTADAPASACMCVAPASVSEKESRPGSRVDSESDSARVAPYKACKASAAHAGRPPLPLKPFHVPSPPPSPPSAPPEPESWPSLTEPSPRVVLPPLPQRRDLGELPRAAGASPLLPSLRPSAPLEAGRHKASGDIERALREERRQSRLRTDHVPHDLQEATLRLLRAKFVRYGTRSSPHAFNTLQRQC